MFGLVIAIPAGAIPGSGIAPPLGLGALAVGYGACRSQFPPFVSDSRHQLAIQAQPPGDAWVFLMDVPPGRWLPRHHRHREPGQPLDRSPRH